ncbi:hypothetical protein MTP99_017162 [Tenebrio molitor]|nr:hypothetical protein MTP99_017162 [Tenebrio molitor]
MVQYTNLELTDMVLIYGEALSNGGAAWRLYMERFPGRQVPCERTFVNAVQHLRDYGTFSPVNRNHNLENAARTRITSLSSSTCPTLKTRRSTTSNCILSMASSKNRRRTQFFKHRLNHR